MTRAEILAAAAQAVSQDRNATHGEPEDSFGLIAAYELGVSVGAAVDRKSTRLNSSHVRTSRMPSSA